ncbi:sterol desaturase family protein [Sandarakinorhabdus sp. AAP62]|uniref:sterol desaturase family protein n=1 Tax=Sandarakinorhabdus sp. AAP62 TaxID=1248916 RepID=UPI0002D35E2D|nr:sterol desaturase family protein [Sandarakinorhabdus sp. AAP62]
MAGVRVGNRIIGAEAPVTIGWENVPRVEGSRLKVLFFTWFQPAVLFCAILFWYYAPNSIAKASVAFGIGLGFRLILFTLEWFFPRHESWKMTWKELAVDLFYVGLGATILETVDGFIGSDVLIELVRDSFEWDKLAWFIGLPLLLQAFLISFIFDFGQYWMHRGMHNWYPLWLTHKIHHYITQFNINKGAVGNPIELFLIGLGIGGFFDFLPRAFLLSGAIGMAVGSYMHLNVRFNTPSWWRFLFNTTEHHSIHHSQDYEATRSNFAGIYIFIDRIFGTCVDGEAEILGQDGGRRMSIPEQMLHPFTEGWKDARKRFGASSTVPAE